ncbi:MAG: DUF4826 family protein [Kiloniellales bacterium]
MTELVDEMTAERVAAWVRRKIAEAVEEFQKRSIADSAVLEAKPAWAFPFNVVIGKVRGQRDDSHFFWTICGDVPCDFLASSVAATPREAARHFALKWQLEAARQRGSEQAALADDRERAAEALYDLVRDDVLWPGG